MALAARSTEAERLEHLAQLRGLQSKAEIMACSLLLNVVSYNVWQVMMSLSKDVKRHSAASLIRG